MSFVRFRDGMYGPTVILFIVCFVVTLAVSAMQKAAAPLIRQSEINASNAAKSAVLSEGDSFTDLEGIDFPQGISQISAADNGAGFAIRSEAKGYGGTVSFMIGVGRDGEIKGISMFQHNETQGLGTRIGQPDYLSRFLGRADPGSVDAVSGATITSNALKTAVRQALEAYELVKEAA